MTLPHRPTIQGLLYASIPSGDYRRSESCRRVLCQGEMYYHVVTYLGDYKEVKLGVYFLKRRRHLRQEGDEWEERSVLPTGAFLP